MNGGKEHYVQSFMLCSIVSKNCVSNTLFWLLVLVLGFWRKRRTSFEGRGACYIGMEEP
jgi:hypothetical protein